MEKETDSQKRITLRMPLTMWQQVKIMAKEEKRSVTAQIVFIIQEFLKQKGKTG